MLAAVRNRACQHIYLCAMPATAAISAEALQRLQCLRRGVLVQRGCVLHCQQAEGIEQVNDRCKLVQRRAVAPQRALDTKLQRVALT